MRMPCALSSCRAASKRTLVVMSSASEATGSTCTTTSASGSTPRTAASTASEISCTFSKGTARSTAIVTSANTSGPLRRSRSLRISPRPATCRTASSTLPCKPLGTLSSRSSIDFFPSWMLTQTTMPATPKAATESAFSSQSILISLGDHHADQPEEHHQRRPDIGRKMQGVGLQRLAIVFDGGFFQRTGAGDIDHDRDADHREMPKRSDSTSTAVVEKEPVARFVDDPHAGDQQQQRLEQRREILELAVAVGMLAVGGQARHPHGPKRHGGGDQVQGGMRRFGQNAQAVRPQADDDFDRRQKHRRHQRPERHPAFFAIGTRNIDVKFWVGIGHAKALFRGPNETRVPLLACPAVRNP